MPAATPVPDLEQRLAFLGLSEDDRQRLKDLLPITTQAGPEFVEIFYKHLFAFESTARFLQDSTLVEHLKHAQRLHLDSMLQADWNESYAAQRFRVGDVHAQVGINPQMFLGAYNQYLQFCLKRLAEGQKLDASQYVESISSLIKVVLLDIGLTLDAYFAQATQNLRQALDMVFEANSELRQFAQFTSHDLKTPLATVANLCDEALDEFGAEMPEEARNLISAARNRTFRMSSTIDELLQSASTLHAPHTAEEVSTEHMMSELLEQLRPMLEAKEIGVTVAEHLPHVSGDAARLREVFYNLLSNAAKFIERRPGKITVDYETSGDVVILRVADNGPGIPADELTKIFVPFRRLAQHRALPGSGLGLYFAKTITEQQGGRIWADSTPGQGSTFCVQLRRANSAS